MVVFYWFYLFNSSMQAVQPDIKSSFKSNIIRIVNRKLLMLAASCKTIHEIHRIHSIMTKGIGTYPVWFLWVPKDPICIINGRVKTI